MNSVHFGVTVPQIKRPWVAAADAAQSFEAQGLILFGFVIIFTVRNRHNFLF